MVSLTELKLTEIPNELGHLFKLVFVGITITYKNLLARYYYVIFVKFACVKIRLRIIIKLPKRWMNRSGVSRLCQLKNGLPLREMQ